MAHDMTITDDGHNTSGTAQCGCRWVHDTDLSSVDGPPTHEIYHCPLHAAAPDLLAALEALVAVEISERSGRPFDQAARIALNDARHMARAAIRKARGEEAIREDRAMTTREAIKTALRERIIEPEAK